ncbi:hypothetical protein BBAL3_2796 [Brevundimonas sp. BAL3]|uniref:hypothetical protein n=1 Tax=Brevundimonas sp. BAL3 TaxID=391600 RepID=UPI00017EB04C|nr:hypothetical protein [Brevundimonas sp. BAL3]EDX81639.1 hypothetical protein BBAL3_2796 [Brevundimonas sp. BAL3]
MTRDHDLPQWDWADLETVLQETAGDGAHRNTVLHILQTTRETAFSLSATDLLREVLALGAIAHSRSASTSRPSPLAASCRGSA